MAGPSGAKVSQPLARHHCRSFFSPCCQFALADVVAAGDAEDGFARLAPVETFDLFADHTTSSPS